MRIEATSQQILQLLKKEFPVVKVHNDENEKVKKVLQ